MQTLAEYEVLGTLHEGAKYNVYQARDLSSHREVVLKATRSQFPSVQEVSNLKREMELSRMVDNPGVIKTLNFVHDKSAYFLVQESIGGTTLKTYIQNHRVGLRKFLQMAIRLTNTLVSIHEKGIIHKDIKPSNIIVNSKSGEIKLTDFSLATQLSQEVISYGPANTIGGTVTYMSPEQTGRVNRSVDYRSDLYSLGATFYEMLIGRPPFIAKTPLDLLCKHITEVPLALHQLDKSIPVVVSKIISKLLEKNAEDRYQSAQGLKYDLVRCRELLEKGRLDTGFNIGEADFSSRLQISEKLYGRKEEVRILLNAFETTCAGRQAVVWVSGSPGIGKSALVSEIYRPITQHKGLYITGKFDQYQSNIPYYAIGQAFNNLCDYLLGEPKKELDHWKTKILKALKGQGQVLVDIIPQLKILLGEQAQLPRLGTKESELRLINTFKSFLGAICSKEKPLVVFLDDVQWADLGSLKLLEKLLSEGYGKYLLFVGAYRKTELFSHHPLVRLLEELKKSKVKQEKIHLENLNIQDVKQMLVESLGLKEEHVLGLSQLIYHKTEGNPFFAKQFFQNLYEQGAIKFSFTQKEWQWDLEEIERQDFSHSVVGLLIQKISRLSQICQEMLQIGAVLGNVFEINLVASLSKHSAKDSLQALWSAVEEGLIKPMGESYRVLGVFEEPWEKTALAKKNKQATLEKQVRFSFVHDRIQEAVYRTLEENKKKILHFKIGNILEKGPQKEDRLYEIVGHYQKSLDLVVEEKDKRQLAELSLKAAKKAMGASAFENALSYATTGINLIKKEGGTVSRETHWGLLHIKALSEFSCVLLKECENTLKNALALAKKEEDKVSAYQLYLSLFLSQNRADEAVQLAKEALSYLGVKVPRYLVSLQALYQFFKFRHWVKKDPKALEKLPQASNKKILNIIEVVFASGPHFLQAAPDMHQYFGLWVANLCIKHGNMVYSPVFYLVGAIFCVVVTQELKLADSIAKASLDISQRYGNMFSQGVVYGAVGNFINHWKNPIEEYQPLMQASYQHARQSGEVHFMPFPFIYTRFQSIFFSSQNLFDIIKENKGCYKAFVEIKNEEHALHQNFILDLLREFAGIEPGFENVNLPFNLKDHEAKMRGSGKYLTRAPFFVLRMIQEYTRENFNKAFEYAQLSSRVTKDLMATLGVFVQRFYFLLSYYAVKENFSFWENLKLFPKIFINRLLLKRLSVENPRNFLIFYSLIKGEEARVKRKYTRAGKFFDQAIGQAEERGWAFPIALCYQITARFYLETKKSHMAKPLFAEAKNILEKWGAQGLAKDLEKRYPIFLAKLIEPRESPKKLSKIESKELSEGEGESWLEETLSKATDSLSQEDLSSYDFQEALKSSYAILGETNYKSLVKTLMKIILENSGADRACLIIKKAEGLYVEADQKLKGKLSLFTSKALSNYPDLPIAIINYVSRVKKKVLFSNSLSYKSFEEVYLKEKSPKSIFVIPIMYQEKFLSLIYLENSQVEEAFTKERQAFLDLIVAQLAISLNNLGSYQDLMELSEELEKKVDERTEALNQLATLDALTGVYNRGQFFQLATAEFKHARLVGSLLSAMIFDLDKFKEINDQYGHAMGDKVLSHVAQLCYRQLSKKDILGRIGGEEFAILLPDTKTKKAVDIGKSLQRIIRDAEMGTLGKSLKISISIGISEAQEKDQSIDDLLRRADDALYQAKARGRDRVECL